VTLVEISGLEVFGRHGALEEERRYGRKFLFDLRLEVGEQASRSDRLEDTVDYRDVVTLVKAVSDGRQFTLLEALARTVAEAMLRQFPPVKQVHVRVRKVGAQLGAPVEWTGASIDIGG
jgi:7,8-dihydroneopterin aldolase/epimerase/oxygenase